MRTVTERAIPLLSLVVLAGSGFILGLPSMANPESATASVAWLAGLVAASTMFGSGLARIVAATALAFTLLSSPVRADPVGNAYVPVAEATEPSNTWLVGPGDHFWAIARGHLQMVLGGPPRTAQVAQYWQELIEANREVIRSGDPDLIYPGELLGLP